MTLEEIRSCKPCISGWRKLTQSLGRTTGPVTLAEIYGSNGYTDSLWCLRCVPFEEFKPWLAEIVEMVLPVFEKQYPDDKRPRMIFEAFKSNNVTDDIDADATDIVSTYGFDSDSASDATAYTTAYVAAAYAVHATDAANTTDAAAGAAYAANAAYAITTRTHAGPYVNAANATSAYAAAANAASAVGLKTIEQIFVKHFVEKKQDEYKLEK